VYHFVTRWLFYGEEFLAPCPTPNRGDHSLSVVRTAYLLYSQLPSISGGRLLHPHPEDAPCHVKRGPHNVARIVTHLPINLYPSRKSIVSLQWHPLTEITSGVAFSREHSDSGMLILQIKGQLWNYVLRCAQIMICLWLQNTFFILCVRWNVQVDVISCEAISRKVGKLKIKIINVFIDTFMSAVLLRSHQSLIECLTTFFCLLCNGTKEALIFYVANTVQ